MQRRQAEEANAQSERFKPKGVNAGLPNHGRLLRNAGDSTNPTAGVGSSILDEEPDVQDEEKKSKAKGGGGKGAANQELAASQERVNAAEKEYSETLKIANLQESAGLISGEQKRQISLQATQKEKQELEAILPEYERQYQAQAKSLNPEQAQKLIDKIEQLKQKIKELGILEESQTFKGQLMGQFQKALDATALSGKNLGTDITQLVQGPFQTLGSSMAGLINGTTTWKQVWQQIESQAISTWANIGAKMLEHLALQLVMNALHRTMATSQVQADASKGAAAAMASASDIPYIGWILSPIAYATTYALALSGLGTFTKGGYTGQGTSHEPAGIVHGGKYVLRLRRHRESASGIWRRSLAATCAATRAVASLEVALAAETVCKCMCITTPI